MGTSLDDLELRHRQLAVQREGRRTVLEPAVLGVFEADQPLGEHGEAVPLAGQNGLGCGYRVGWAAGRATAERGPGLTRHDRTVSPSGHRAVDRCRRGRSGRRAGP